MTKLNKKELTECWQLTNWLDGVKEEEIDAALEWLVDSNYLTKKGKRFAHSYWEYCFHTSEKIKKEL